VVRTTGVWQEVLANGERISCRVRGKLRLREEETTHPVAVGDRVDIEISPDGIGTIGTVHQRTSQLSRRAAGKRRSVEHVIAANLDMVWIIQALKKPKYNAGFIDRVLVMAEYGDVEAGLVINKMDLAREAHPDERLQMMVKTYQEIGYPVFQLSAKTGGGVADFVKQLRGKRSAVVGPSGVGKSTLLNAVQPGLGLKTSDVSERTKKGTHTTAYASMYELEGGGEIIDTPGVREYGLLNMEKVALAAYFRDINLYADQCGFANCVHDHEPDCAVREAVERGKLSVERFVSYLNILDSL